MKVIGAGLPRTATLTSKVALEMVGFRPCYHMVNVLADPALAPEWAAAFDGGPDWDLIFGGCQASVGWPGSFFWRELVECYPDAKVLLSVRSGASWANSMQHTIWGILSDDALIRQLSDARASVDPGWRDYTRLMTAMLHKSGLIGDLAGPFNAPAAGAAMERHNQEVRETVPAGQLLEWQPADGWAPLCEFLEVPVPPVPIPRINDSAMFGDRIVDSSLAALIAWRARHKTRPRSESGPPPGLPARH